MKWMVLTFRALGLPNGGCFLPGMNKKKWDRAAKAATGGSVSDSYQV